MKFIGAHVSIAGGVQNAPKNAKEIGANAFALFTRNQRQWHAKPYSEKNIKEFKRNLKEFNFNIDYVLPHASYLINLCSPDREMLERSRNAFIEELNRTKQLGLKYLNVHPGAHKNKLTLKESIKLMVESIEIGMERVEDVTIVIELTAGEGSVIGYRFEHIAEIIDGVENKNRIGVCLDTCHMFAAGYNITDEHSFNNTMAEFDKVIGLKYLKGMHLNDSKHPLGSRKDRHENLGKGHIGLEAFRLIVNDRRTNYMPLILETPNNENWAQEIKLLRSLIKKI